MDLHVDLESLAEGLTLPASWYTDPAVLRLEHERIFRRTWQYAGHTGQVAERGDYFTCRAGDVPVVVVRDREQSVRAFANVCRHRAHEVARGAGRRETLQCPYHAWTYGLDGSLRKAPRSDREPGFDRSAFSLAPVRVETWGPFVFVNADPEAGPLADALAELPALLAGGGVDVAALRFHSRAPTELDANWKVACENYLECYHCAVAHPAFSAQIDVSPDAYRLEESETFWSQYAALRDGGKPSYDARGEVERGQFHLLWPNVKLNVVPGRPNVSIGPVLPVSPERSSGFLDYFFADDADDAWIEDVLAFDDQVGREDKGLVESVQRGLASGAVERGRLLLNSEHLIHGFQRRVAETLL
jgi:phenylpropionate dioxygenase-like ring-hydroxylating dioxygenase large terminal subunit